jgi:hypothetical protein
MELSKVNFKNRNKISMDESTNVESVIGERPRKHNMRKEQGEKKKRVLDILHNTTSLMVSPSSASNTPPSISLVDLASVGYYAVI